MKQTKTALKELTAAYRAVLKHAAIAAFGAMVSVGAASAYTQTSDVNFAGKYDGGKKDANTEITDSGYKYTTTAADGTYTQGTAALTTDNPDASLFLYSNPDGTPGNMNNTHVIGDYAVDSSVDGTIVKATAETNIAAGSSVSKDNYSYQDAKDPTKYITLGDTERDFVETITLKNNNNQPGSTVITVTNGVADAEISASSYSFTYTSTLTKQDITLYLNPTADGAIDAGGGTYDIDDAEIAGKAALQAAIDAYKADVKDLGDLVTNTGGYKTTEHNNFVAANGYYETDANKITDLDKKWATYTNAQTAYETTAPGEQSAAQLALKNAQEEQGVAYDIYHQSIEDTINNGAVVAINDALAENGDITQAIADKSDADREYADGKVAELANGAVAQNTQDIADINNAETGILATSQKYADGKVAELADGAVAQNTQDIADINNAETGILANAKSYTDELADGAVATNAANIQANADAIGNMEDIADTTYAKGNARAATTTLAQAIVNLDGAMSDEAAARAAADEAVLGQAKAYADAQNTLTLKAANDYTDQKVGQLEKEVSAGIASATALSSVAVSNVGKGEVSVGGGYGYYNSQSAVAFGAAMGLTDNWSVNAGAGLSDGNVAFRAGTNYKFKLF